MQEINKLLDKIESNEIVLPEFQREFVWKKDSSKELMISLYKNYPIGSLLIWETRKPPEIKNDAVKREQYGLFKVLLDGQQRLTVLYLLVKNQTPPYYKESEIRHDPRNLCFNLISGEFRYENKSIKNSIEWVKVVDAFNNNIRIFDIAREKVTEDDEVSNKAEQYKNQLDRLEKIKNLHIPLQELPKSANLHQAIDLFHKVNSQGEDLNDTELTLAHMSAQWPYIRREMKKKKRKMSTLSFDFGLDFYVKCLVGILIKSMKYKKAYNIPEDNLKEKWDRLDKTLDFVVNFLKNEANMPDSSYFSSRAVLIPFIVYIEQNDIRLNYKEKQSFLYWIYTALMWSRYGGSTDSKLEKDISLLGKKGDPTKKLVEEIKDQRGRLKLQGSDLKMRGKRSKRFFNMIKILIRSNNPVDWQTGEPLKGNYNLESHHIFPKSKLYNNFYDLKHSEQIQKVNEIANRAFLTPKGNKEISNELPDKYLPEVYKNYPKALKTQFIPENKELWKIENYEEFLKKRRTMLSEKINEFLANLKSFESESKEVTLEEIIEEGENQKTEFKETLLYDVYQNQPNKDLKFEIAKEVASFANADGGSLLIGIKDNPIKIVGIRRDLKLMKKGLDSFELQLNQTLSKKLGEAFTAIYVRVNFEEIEDKTICIVSVEPSAEPVFYGDEEEFFIRSGSSKRALGIREAKKYIDNNWQ